jgi:hypothetical protein
MVAAMEREDRDGFPLTADASHCRFCTYRSLCRRGDEAGHVDSLADPEEAGSATETVPSFDFDQIGEIAF